MNNWFSWLWREIFQLLFHWCWTEWSWVFFHASPSSLQGRWAPTCSSLRQRSSPPRCLRWQTTDFLSHQSHCSRLPLGACWCWICDSETHEEDVSASSWEELYRHWLKEHFPHIKNSLQAHVCSVTGGDFMSASSLISVS